MMLRIVLAALSLATASAAYAGEALDAIKARGVLLVGTPGDFKPFAFRESDGHYRGADVVMAERIAERLGVIVAFVPTTWRQMTDDFKAGKFDIAVGGITITPARQEVGDFSAPVVTDGKTPLARCADQDKFTSLAAIDSPGVRVVTNPGGSNERFARERLGQAQITVHKDNVSIFDELIAGRADVMVTDGIEAMHQAMMHPELCPAHIAIPFTRFEDGYWLPHDPALKAAVDATIGQAKASGEWDRIFAEAQKQP